MKKLFLLILSLIGFNYQIYSQVLISESFEGVFAPVGWTVLNNGSGNDWVQDANYSSVGSNSMAYYYNSSNAADAWSFSPSISLNVGDSIVISFDQRVRSSAFPEALQVTIGNAQTVVSQTTVLYSDANLTNTTFTQILVSYKATVAGTYYIGFNCFSLANQWNLYVDNVHIEKILMDNVGITAITSPNSGCSLTSSEVVSVSIKNTGILAASGFPVSYSLDNNTPVTETVTATIAPGATIFYSFTSLVDLSVVGPHTLKVYTSLTNDSDAMNDTLLKNLLHATSGPLVKSTTDSMLIPDNSPLGIISPIIFCGLPSSLDGVALAIDYIRIDSLLHTYAADLSILLISPTNDTLDISLQNGGFGDNIINATFIDTSLSNIVNVGFNGIPPGSYYVQDPAGLVSYHNGQNPNGEWKLFITDGAGSDMGTLYKWTMAFKIPLANDIGITTIQTPNSGCGLSASEVVTVEIKNYALANASGFPVSYVIDGNTPVTEIIAATIAPGATYTYSFTAVADLSIVGPHSIQVYTSLTGDGAATNDTANKNVVHITPGVLTKSSAQHIAIPDVNPNGATSSIPFCGLPTSLDGFALKIDYLKIDTLFHSYSSDLNIYLVSPANDTLDVSINNGGSGSNVIEATFTDTASTNISSINFGGIQAGYYHVQDPAGLASYYSGQDPNGDWKLWVVDNASGDVGTINKWTLSFVIPMANNIGIETIISPNSGCSLSASEVVSVKIKNYGSAAASGFPVSYSLDNNTPVTETVAATIAPGGTLTYNFTAVANLSVTGMHTLKAYTSLLNDGDANNDTVYKNVEHAVPGIFTKFSADSLLIPDNSPSGAASPLTFCGLPVSLDGFGLIIDYIRIDSLLHTYSSDLKLYLISPTNDSLLVSLNNGGSGDNILNATFTDTASTNVSTINSGGIQAGYYHVQDPAGFASYYTGQDPNGTWKLAIIDDVNQDIGMLYKWTMSFAIPTHVNNNENASDGLIVYPNPSNGNLTIETVGFTGQSKVNVYNVLGEVVLAKQFTDSKTQIDLSNSEHGIYFISIENNDNKYTKKIIIR